MYLGVVQGMAWAGVPEYQASCYSGSSVTMDPETDPFLLLAFHTTGPV